MNDFLLEALKTLGVIFAPILAALVTALLVHALQKAGLNLDAEKTARLEHFVQQAILRAEEWAATAAKRNMPPASGMKLAKAITDVVAKVPGITDAEATALIQAELPKVGLGAAGFLGAVRTAAATPEPAA